MTWQEAVRKALHNCYNWTGGAALIRVDGGYDACAPVNAPVFRGEIIDFWDQLPPWFWRHTDRSPDPQEWHKDELDAAISSYIATLEEDNEWLSQAGL